MTVQIRLDHSDRVYFHLSSSRLERFLRAIILLTTSRSSKIRDSSNYLSTMMDSVQFSPDSPRQTASDSPPSAGPVCTAATKQRSRIPKFRSPRGHLRYLEATLHRRRDISQSAVALESERVLSLGVWHICLFGRRRCNKGEQLPQATEKLNGLLDVPSAPSESHNSRSNPTAIGFSRRSTLRF